MTTKPPLWADLILSVWICIVGVIYFGGYFLPDTIGIWTERASKCYAAMLLLSVATAALRFLAGRRTDNAVVPQSKE